MSDATPLGPWIRRFLLEHLVGERNLTANTQRSYRDAFKLLLPFLATRWQKPIERLTVEDVSTDMVRLFLSDLQESRRCGIATRNQRLAAVRALSRFVAEHSPEHVAWCAQMCSLPFKKGVQTAVPYLEKAEMDALLGSADTATAQGGREHALLLFLYNSGARAGEAAQVVVSDLELTPSPLVRLLGKGRKERHCPLWPATARLLSLMITSRSPSEPVFLNRCSQPITRFGIHKLVRRCALRAAVGMPSLIAKRVSPHTIRHYVDFRTMSRRLQKRRLKRRPTWHLRDIVRGCYGRTRRREPHRPGRSPWSKTLCIWHSSLHHLSLSVVRCQIDDRETSGLCRVDAYRYCAQSSEKAELLSKAKSLLVIVLKST